MLKITLCDKYGSYIKVQIFSPPYYLHRKGFADRRDLIRLALAKHLSSFLTKISRNLFSNFILF